MRVGMRQTYVKGPEDVVREVVDTVVDIPSSSRDGVRRHVVRVCGDETVRNAATKTNQG